MSGDEILHPTDHAKPDVVPQQRVELGSQIPLEQLHERAHLGGGPLPVLHREARRG